MRAGAGGGRGDGSERTSCARRRMRAWGGGSPAGGGARGGEAQGGERLGLRPPTNPALLLWGRLFQCFRCVSPGPHAFAGVTSYQEAPESGSWAGVSASWGGDGLGECGSTSGCGRHPQSFASPLSGFLPGRGGGWLTRVNCPMFTESHNIGSQIQSDSGTSRRCQ